MSKQKPASGFDYSGLDASITRQLKSAVARILEAIRNERAATIVVGKELISAKSILKSRQEAFVPWLQKECGINPRTANRYMATARMFGDKPEAASRSPTQVLYGLAQTKKLSAPAKKLVSEIKRGNVVSLADYRNAVASASRAKQTAGNKPGASVKEWWAKRPEANLVAKHINHKQWLTFHSAVVAAHKRAA